MTTFIADDFAELGAALKRIEDAKKPAAADVPAPVTEKTVGDFYTHINTHWGSADLACFAEAGWKPMQLTSDLEFVERRDFPYRSISLNTGEVVWTPSGPFTRE